MIKIAFGSDRFEESIIQNVKETYNRLWQDLGLNPGESMDVCKCNGSAAWGYSKSRRIVQSCKLVIGVVDFRVRLLVSLIRLVTVIRQADRLMQVKSVEAQKPRIGVVGVWREEYQIGCCPRQVIDIQDDEVHHRIHREFS
ncbi:uncharacterized protein TNCV_998251 [Trichonephila clavipes]|nr:uncharacterized protein TNCV_998251 [Trichonephila clavipes]